MYVTDYIFRKSNTNTFSGKTQNFFHLLFIPISHPQKLGILLEVCVQKSTRLEIFEMLKTLLLAGLIYAKLISMLYNIRIFIWRFIHHHF